MYVPNEWELLILGADFSTDGCLTVGDIEGDGNEEIVTGGTGALLWYRPATFEKGIIAEIDPHVGVTLEDIDGDGILEVIVGHRTETGSSTEDWMIGWFKPTSSDLSKPWVQHVIDPHTTGGPHDMLFADVDGDGETELIANSMYSETPGLYVYKRGQDPTRPWKRHSVQDGFSAEGTAAADLTGNGRIEIISGPYLYIAPADGPFSGPWEQHNLVAGFREMCRAVLVDVTGDSRLDVVIVESEYPDGRMSWVQNRSPDAWVEHPMERPLNFAHSLSAWKDGAGVVHVFVAEMAQGGWNPPYNWDARLLQFTTGDKGQHWQRELAYQGAGTHEATASDVDGDGEVEFVGKECWRPKVQIWKRRKQPSALLRFRHHFIDREKPWTGTDILASDVDGDGLQDVVCAAFWYKNPTWERYQIPGVYQVHVAYDIDGDGRDELICTKRKPGAEIGYPSLGSDLCWVKAVDPVNGKWEEHPIGTGDGDWPHGTTVAPLFSGGKLGLIVGYHSAEEEGDLPELFQIPDDPTESPWPKHPLAEIPYGEGFAPHDFTGNGKLDIAAGRWWLENVGDGDFRVYQIVGGDDYKNVARVRVADVNGNSRPDIVVVEESVAWGEIREAYFVRVAWFENPGDPRQVPWKAHVIDTVRSPHSLDVADLDGDGQPEIVVGEHDPFKPYRSRCRLYIYKKAEPQGRAWYRYPIEDRFEHHDGTKVFEVAPGKLAIISHAWMDVKYVHLWEPY